MSAKLTVGVCGAGAMGSGIAQVAAQAGAQVIVFDVQDRARETSRAGITKGLEQSITRGRLTREDADAVLGALSWTNNIADLGNCALVIEAIIEDADIKQGLFAQLEDVLSDQAILATNTSSLPIGRLARGLRHPARFIGMHFFNPATAMKLVEVVSGPATSPAIAAQVAQLATDWGKIAVPVADVPGFIVNRVARPFYAEAFRALQENVAAPEVIDHLFKAAAGFRMGPLELTDLIGQDVNFAVARSVYDSYFGQTRFTPQRAQAALVDAGWLGRKTGRGVYDYREDVGTAKAQPIVVTPLTNAPPRPENISPTLEPLIVGDVVIRFSRGLTARDEAVSAGCPVAVIDWFAASTAKAAGFAASDDHAAQIVASLLTAWGLDPFRLADRPGLIIMRTLAQIANGAGDAVLEQVSDEDGIDKALLFGANYPFGPFAWVEQIRAPALCDTLAAVAASTGQSMYSPSFFWNTRRHDR